MTTYGIVAALVLQAGAQQGAARPRAQEPRGLVEAAPAPVLTLEEALRTAEVASLDLKVAQARLDQSKELHYKAWSAYLPQVTAGGTFTHNNVGAVAPLPAFTTVRARTSPAGTNPNEPADPPDNPITHQPLPGAPSQDVFLFTQNVDVEIQKQNQLSAQIQATQAIFAPQAIYAIAAARAGERVAADSTEQARRDILFGVTQAYYAAAGLKQVVAVQDRQLAIARDHERDARVRYEAGTTPKVTLLRAEIDRARAEQDLKRAQNSYVAAKVSLATLLDRRDVSFEVEVPPPALLPEDTSSLEEAAVHDRPDVLAAGEQVTVSEKSRDGVVTRYLPTLGAFGRYLYSNASGFSGSSTSWAIGLSLSWTIFDGGLRESDLRENQARVAEAVAARDATLNRARDEVVRARLDLDSAVANREKAKEQLALAEENQRLVNVNYKAGAATYIEVSDANTALLTAELTQVSESLNADLAALRLLKAAGVWNGR
jgi:outer membrane protein TolC